MQRKRKYQSRKR